MRRIKGGDKNREEADNKAGSASPDWIGGSGALTFSGGVVPLLHKPTLRRLVALEEFQQLTGNLLHAAGG